MKYETKKIPKDWGWVILAVVTILFRIILPAEIIEKVYSRGLFQLIRLVIDNTVGLLPFPTLYLFVAGLLFLLIKNIRNAIQSKAPFKLEKWLVKYGFPINGRVRGRLLRPKGTLLSISTAGVYLPWVGEGHIDAGMYEIQFPFVIAHEMSHGYGFTDEGTCNFIAYQAMRESDNPFFRYSAVLGYWVYLANAIAQYDYEAYKSFYKTLPLGIRNDRRIIRQYSDSYPDIMPYFRDAFYNQYLKTQGIEEGMKNYSRVVMLAAAWREKNRKD